jgi:hypothetical protein
MATAQDLSRQTHGSKLSGSLTDLLGLETLIGALITVESASKAGAVVTGGPEAHISDGDKCAHHRTSSLAAAEKRRFKGVALARCHQSSDENASSNCQSVFQSCNSQIRHIAAEPLPHVITGKGPCDRPYSAENCSVHQGPFYHAVNCCPADRARYNAGRKRPRVQSARRKG